MVVWLDAYRCGYRDAVGDDGPEMSESFPSFRQPQVSESSPFGRSPGCSAFLDSLPQDLEKPLEALRRYPEIFRRALENDNRICLCSFMSAQFYDLSDAVRTEVQAFTNVNVAWLKKMLIAAKMFSPREAKKRARAIYSGIVGAQLMARSRADITLYDTLIESYRAAALLPA